MKIEVKASVEKSGGVKVLEKEYVFCKLAEKINAGVLEKVSEDMEKWEKAKAVKRFFGKKYVDGKYVACMTVRSEAMINALLIERILNDIFWLDMVSKKIDKKELEKYKSKVKEAFDGVRDILGEAFDGIWERVESEIKD